MPGPAGPEAEAAMWKAGGPNASESKVDFATERPSVMLLPRGREGRSERRCDSAPTSRRPSQAKAGRRYLVQGGTWGELDLNPDAFSVSSTRIHES